MTEAVPKDCCGRAARTIDVWDNELLPDEIECPECGNIGVITPWQKETGVKGIEVEGYRIDWVLPAIPVMEEPS